MRRVLVSVVLGSLLAATVALPALAAKPERDVIGAPPPIDYPAGALCAYAVRVEFPINKEYGIAFTPQPDGSQRIIVTGRLVAMVTNLETGESVTLNASGPGTFWFAPDGTLTIAGGGHWLLYLFPTDVGGPGIFYTSGRIHLEAGPTGVTGLTMPRNTRDICAMLAE